MSNFRKLDEYLTIAEASKLLGVSISTLRNWDKQGKLKAYRNPMNKYRLYRKDYLEQILDKIIKR